MTETLNYIPTPEDSYSNSDGLIDRRPSSENHILEQGIGVALSTKRISLTWGTDKRLKETANR